MKEMVIFRIEEVDYGLTKPLVRYEVVSYYARIRTIHAISRTYEEAEVELNLLKAGQHSTQVLPGGSLPL